MAGKLAIINHEKRQEAAEIIWQVCKQHGLNLPKFHNEIYLSDVALYEHTSQKFEISKAILDFMFPKEPSPCTLYHYTNLDGLGGITSSAELRLYPIKKRIDEGGELRAFAEAHDLSGYLNIERGKALYKKLSEDLFYISLTRPVAKDPVLMWGGFAANVGVCIEFEIEPKWAELRPVQYERNGNTSLLAEINHRLDFSGYPPFTPWAISRIGAFHLSSTVSLEDEVRLLVKRFEGGADLTRNDGTYDYWPIPICASNDYCSVKLTGIRAAPNSNIDDIKRKLANTAFASVPLTGP